MLNIPPVTVYAPNGDAYTTTEFTSKENTIIRHLLDLSSKKERSALDPDLEDLILKIQNEDFSAQAQVIILDLIRLLAQIRKQNQELWQSDANLALKTADNVAKAQKAQAQLTANAAYISAGASIVQGVVDGATTIATAVIANNKANAAKVEADKIFGVKPDTKSTGTSTSTDTDADIDGPSTKGTADSLKGPAPSVQARPENDYGDIKTLQKQADPLKDIATDAKPKGADADVDGPAAGGDNNNQPTQKVNKEIDEKAKAQFLADKIRSIQSTAEMQQKVVSAILSVATGSMKSLAAWQELAAGDEQARATVEQAVMNYLQSRGQFTNEYASEMRDAIKTVLDLLKSTEAARHQARNAIINIV